MQTSPFVLSLLTALAVSPLPVSLAAEASDVCPRQPAADDQGGPIGSMQRDELLADGLGQPRKDACRITHTPLISELTRHVARFDDELWWNDGSGTSLGVVHRAHWRQIFRDHFVYLDEGGRRRAEGTQPRLSAGLLYSSLGELYVTAADGELLVYMRGTPWTLAKVRFELQDRDGKRIADAHVDMKKSSVVFTPPDKPLVRIASLLREQVTDDGYDRWRLIVLHGDVLPDDAWPVLAAFFARYQDPKLLANIGRATLRALCGG